MLFMSMMTISINLNTHFSHLANTNTHFKPFQAKIVRGHFKSRRKNVPGVAVYNVPGKTTDLRDFVVSGGVGDTCDRQAALSNPHLQVSNKDLAIFSVRALLSFF